MDKKLTISEMFEMLGEKISIICHPPQYIRWSDYKEQIKETIELIDKLKADIKEVRDVT